MSQYATTDDLTRLGIGGNTLAAVDSTSRTAALVAWSAYADGYLAKRFTLPLVAWGDDLRQAVVDLAAWKVLATRGFDPTSAKDVAVRDSRDDAEAWLTKVARGTIEPQGITDSTPAVTETRSVVVVSRPRRGW